MTTTTVEPRNPRARDTSKPTSVRVRNARIRRFLGYEAEMRAAGWTVDLRDENGRRPVMPS